MQAEPQAVWPAGQSDEDVEPAVYVVEAANEAFGGEEAVVGVVLLGYVLVTKLRSVNV